MGALKKIPSEGGSGGKRGHSAMEHAALTAEIKDAARTRRRIGDRNAVKEGFAEVSPHRGPRKRRRTKRDSDVLYSRAGSQAASAGGGHAPRPSSRRLRRG